MSNTYVTVELVCVAYFNSLSIYFSYLGRVFALLAQVSGLCVVRVYFSYQSFCSFVVMRPLNASSPALKYGTPPGARPCVRALT